MFSYNSLDFLLQSGNFSFANDTSNPLDSGYAYANAILGTTTHIAKRPIGWTTHPSPASSNGSCKITGN
jgi:hypothetical protein